MPPTNLKSAWCFVKGMWRLFGRVGTLVVSATGALWGISQTAEPAGVVALFLQPVLSRWPWAPKAAFLIAVAFVVLRVYWKLWSENEELKTHQQSPEVALAIRELKAVIGFDEITGCDILIEVQTALIDGVSVSRELIANGQNISQATIEQLLPRFWNVLLTNRIIEEFGRTPVRDTYYKYRLAHPLGYDVCRAIVLEKRPLLAS